MDLNRGSIDPFVGECRPCRLVSAQAETFTQEASHHHVFMSFDQKDHEPAAWPWTCFSCRVCHLPVMCGIIYTTTYMNTVVYTLQGTLICMLQLTPIPALPAYYCLYRAFSHRQALAGCRSLTDAFSHNDAQQLQVCLHKKK